MTPAEAAAIKDGACCVGLVETRRGLDDHVKEDTAAHEYLRDGLRDIYAKLDKIQWWIIGLLVMVVFFLLKK